jgi:hypothetical protein
MAWTIIDLAEQDLWSQLEADDGEASARM